jgi:hypothetical protein
VLAFKLFFDQLLSQGLKFGVNTDLLLIERLLDEFLLFIKAFNLLFNDGSPDQILSALLLL